MPASPQLRPSLAAVNAEWPTRNVARMEEGASFNNDAISSVYCLSGATIWRVAATSRCRRARATCSPMSVGTRGAILVALISGDR